MSWNVRTAAGSPYTSWTIAFIRPLEGAGSIWRDSTFVAGITAICLGLLKDERLLLRNSVRLRLETFEEEPEWQHQLKEETGNREIEADVDPEDFRDGPRHENRVADQARK